MTACTAQQQHQLIQAMSIEYHKGDAVWHQKQIVTRVRLRFYMSLDRPVQACDNTPSHPPVDHACALINHCVYENKSPKISTANVGGRRSPLLHMRADYLIVRPRGSLMNKLFLRHCFSLSSCSEALEPRLNELLHLQVSMLAPICLLRPHRPRHYPRRVSHINESLSLPSPVHHHALIH